MWQFKSAIEAALLLCTNPYCLVQAGAGYGEVSHSHVIDWLLCFGNDYLLLEAVQNHQWAYYSVAKLHRERETGQTNSNE